MSALWKHALWLAWLVALAVGGTAVAEFGTRGAWYQGWAIGAAVGMATWIRRPAICRQSAGAAK